jgi:hypothetical protein
MLSPWVGKCMLFDAKLGKLYDYLMLVPVRHSFVVVPVIVMPALSSKVYLCASCITSPGLHTFGSCGFRKCSQAI